MYFSFDSFDCEDTKLPLGRKCAEQMMQELLEWDGRLVHPTTVGCGQQFDVPLLTLTPLDLDVTKALVHWLSL